MKNLRVLSFFVFLVFTQDVFSQNRLNLETGKKYEKTTTTNSTTTMRMMGQEMEMIQKEKSVSLLEIIAEKEDYFEFTNTLTAVQVSVEQMGQEASFDSEKAAGEQGSLAAAYEDYLNKERKIKIDKTGKVVKPEGEEDQEKLEEELANSQEAFTMFIALPEEIAVGKTWTENQSFHTDEVEIESNKTYEVKAIEENLITLNLSGDININQEMVNQGTEVKSKLKGSLTGEIIVDKNSHVVKKEESFTKMEGNTHTSGMDIPMQVNTTTNTSIKEI